MTRFPVPVTPTTTNRPRCGDQHKPFQLLSVAGVLVVHVIPSGEVMTRLPVPLIATATKRLRSGDQHTPYHILSAAEVLAVARNVELVIPPLTVIGASWASGSNLMIMTLLPVPEIATVANIPSCGAQQTEFHWLSVVETRAVHVMPSGDVIMRLPEPVFATARNIPRSAAQHTDLHALSAADVRAVHVIPSGEVITRLPVPVSATATNSPRS